MRFIEIGANLTDAMYQGVYNGNTYHTPDLDRVLSRAWDAGVEKIIITGGNLSESEEALKLAMTDDRLFCTVGCHPTRCGEFTTYEGGADAYLAALEEVLNRGKALGKVVAVGECGLDYDRLHFCDAETQRKYFEFQFTLAEQSGLPMFLHLRAAAADFVEIMRRRFGPVKGGVVHSFTGTAEEAEQILAIAENVYIGLNGCSLRTEESLAVAAALPAARLMLETDCPWCEVKNTHAGRGFLKTPPPRAVDKKKHVPDAHVKGRNEPDGIRQVLEVLAGCRGLGNGSAAEAEAAAEALAEEIFRNTERVFFSPQGNNGAGESVAITSSNKEVDV